MFTSPLGPEWCKFHHQTSTMWTYLWRSCFTLRQLLPVSTVKHELSIRPRPHPHMPQVSLLQSDRRAAVVLLISGWLVSAGLPHRCCWAGGYTSDSHWPSRHERFLSSARVKVSFLPSDMCRGNKASVTLQVRLILILSFRNSFLQIIDSILKHFSFTSGCHLHSEHAADKCQRLGAGTTRAQQPSAAAERHERLPGASRPHGEPIRAEKTFRITNSVIVDMAFSVIWRVCLCVSKVDELDHLNIIHVTGTKGKVSWCVLHNCIKMSISLALFYCSCISVSLNTQSYLEIRFRSEIKRQPCTNTPCNWTYLKNSSIKYV